ncbi:hypothetical protein [Acidithiobacillus ferriphilus]|uniref:hypothetical protein n=1 Tax=Acidithiobacillus ferriphilus TaxID=1689834 RepID=UPI002DBF6F35|nr:hypothetical protein [Acidithiobacillus ferriphilus]MEB8474558.1 hypothetical protein [Acidithiobacillus ferriphilus]
MKKLALAVLIAACGVAGASDASANAIVNVNNEFGVAVTGTLTNYQEHITPGPSDIESGWQPGVNLKEDMMGHVFGLANVYFGLRYNFSSGGIAYQGAYQDGTPVDATDNGTFNRFVLRFGKGFLLTDRAMITPYIAGGLQLWNRNLRGPGGYTENYGAGLAGGGLLFQYAWTHRLVMGLNADGFAVMDGYMNANSVGAGTANFGNSAEEKLSLTADYRFAGPWHWYIGTSFTHFNYTGGPLIDAVEPSSSTNQLALVLGLAGSFA